MTALRSALFGAWFYGLTFAMGVVGLAWQRRGWRAGVRFARLWARLSLGGLRVLCGVRWVVEGAEHLPRHGPALIASMHQSAFDTLVWALIAPDFTYVLKRELTRVPLFGGMLRAAGMIAVDRDAGLAALRGLMADADRAVAEGRQIVIFPEGTRALPGEILPLHPGVAALAARTGLPVIPVATDSGLFWGRRAFRKRAGVLRVAIQPPIPAGLSRPELIARLERAFRDGAARLAATSPAAAAGGMSVPGVPDGEIHPPTDAALRSADAPAAAPDPAVPLGPAKGATADVGASCAAS